MTQTMQYSIVYAVIRPEINERLSVGIILTDGERTIFRYSNTKLRAVKELYTANEYDFFRRMIVGLQDDPSITTANGINYLSRYSNNLMAVTALQDIALPLTEETCEWAFTQYIDRSARKSA